MYDIIITCAAGFETMLKHEIQRLKVEVTKVEDRLIWTKWSQEDIMNINLWSRLANKVFIVLKQDRNIETFDQLFESVRSIKWKDIVWEWQKIVVNAESIKSALESLPSIQAISKKAIVSSILDGKMWMLQEESSGVDIHIILKRNSLFVLLNTSGRSLHNRGYRQYNHEASIKESLAAWIVYLAYWSYKKPLIDFFCWWGTIPVEAAMMAKNIAPWKFRDFAFEDIVFFDNLQYTKLKRGLPDMEMQGKTYDIRGYDADPLTLRNAQQNADAAGVGDIIQFAQWDFRKLQYEYSDIWMVSNPPYGLRLEDRNIDELYQRIVDFYERQKNIHGWVITTYNMYEQLSNPKDWKSWRLYNWGEICHFYQHLNKYEPGIR